MKPQLAHIFPPERSARGGGPRPGPSEAAKGPSNENVLNGKKKGGSNSIWTAQRYISVGSHRPILHSER